MPRRSQSRLKSHSSLLATISIAVISATELAFSNQNRGLSQNFYLLLFDRDTVSVPPVLMLPPTTPTSSVTEPVPAEITAAAPGAAWLNAAPAPPKLMAIATAQAAADAHDAALPKDRAAWDRDDRQESIRLHAVVTGLKADRARAAAEYNARARMANRRIFRTDDPTTPSHIDE